MKLGDNTPCWCVLGFHWECENKPAEDECCCSEAVTRPLGITGPQKANEEVTDPKSTGRKRAAITKPITEGMACEWKGLRSAGGGVFPIVGCLDGRAQGIHHGPDKNTLNNSDENLHRICDVCHNRWHSRNDRTYPEDIPGTTWHPMGISSPHDPRTTATDEETVKSEIYWATRPKARKAIVDV